ncbi:MAG TPA: response regulator transcription factor [Aggregatilineales bacterium]|nr:response regulator transcription factor [Aggregatilineales bacterium]
MTEQKSQILIVEDDLDLAEMLNSYFRVQGYEVQTAAWGEDAVRMSNETTPDLVVLDIRLPDIDGYEVCRQIRSNRRTAHMPVIFLTEKRDRVDKLAGLELGVVDYITKPFDIQELRLRVRNALERSKQAPQINPITNTAEESLTDEYLIEVLNRAVPWSILCVQIAGLEPFREHYGFVASDDVLRAVTLMVTNAVRDAGTSEDFIGHFNRQDTVIITRPDRVQLIRERIELRLGDSLAYFYPLKDRDRLEEMPEDERLRLIIGVLHSTDGDFSKLDALKKAILQSRETIIE